MPQVRGRGNVKPLGSIYTRGSDQPWNRRILGVAPSPSHNDPVCWQRNGILRLVFRPIARRRVHRLAPDGQRLAIVERSDAGHVPAVERLFREVVTPEAAAIGNGIGPIRIHSLRAIGASDILVQLHPGSIGSACKPKSWTRCS